jgi:hypothetical protein
MRDLGVTILIGDEARAAFGEPDPERMRAETAAAFKRIRELFIDYYHEREQSCRHLPAKLRS